LSSDDRTDADIHNIARWAAGERTDRKTREVTGIRTVLSALADLVVPAVCLVCGELDVPLCGSCERRILFSGSVRRTVAVSGYPLVIGHTAVVAGPELLRLITAFKDSGRSDLAPLLGRLMSARLPPPGLVAAEVVVAVPQSRRAYIRRGWDPVATLARAAGYSVTHVLEVQARHVDQTTLSRQARWQNVSQTMRVTPGALDVIRGRRVTIVDDVMTTGATVSEAARALWAAGARDVTAVALASVERAQQQTLR
jgi:predicted amidophosphoribosyltransferase